MAKIMVKTITLTEREWQLITDALQYGIKNEMYDLDELYNRAHKIIKQIEAAPSRDWLEGVQ